MKFPNIPQDLPPSMQTYLRDLSMMLDKELTRRIPNTEGAGEALLVSPSRKVYAVRVDDAGTVTSTLVRDA